MVKEILPDMMVRGPASRGPGAPPRFAPSRRAARSRDAKKTAVAPRRRTSRRPS